MYFHTRYFPLCFLFYLFLSFYLQKFSKIFVEADISPRLKCEASLKESGLECFVSSSAPFRHHPTETKVSCESKSPIGVKVDYVDGIPEPAFWNMKRERGYLNFTDTTTYFYFLTLLHPRKVFVKELRKLKDVIGVKYSVFNRDFPKKQIQILWFELETRGAVSFSGNQTIIVEEEIVNIPCVDVFPRVPQLYRVDKTVRTKNRLIPVPVNNSSISYHPANGFKINITNSSEFEDTFSCAGKYFTLQKQPNIQFASQFHHLALNPPILKGPFVYTIGTRGFNASHKEENNENQTILVVYNVSQFDLSCTSKTENLTFQYETIPGSIKPMADVIYLRREKPEITYTAKVTTNKIGPELKYVKINCWSPYSGKIFHEWEIFYHDLFSHFDQGFDNTLRVQPKMAVESADKKQQLLCLATGIERERGSTPAVIDSLDFIQMECNEKLSCTELAPGLFKSIQSGDALGSFASLLTMYNVNQKTLDALPKGFYQCSMNNTFPAYNISGTVVLQGFYFLGFDDKYYVGDVDPPDEAILNLQIWNQPDSILSIPGSYTFVCQAHSFYFDDGLRWFFQFHNGTQIRISNANFTERVNDKRRYGDTMNTMTVAEIKLEENTVQKIICAAPHASTLNFTSRHSWKFAEISLKSEYWKAAKIHHPTDGIVKHFRIGDKDQVLKCEADGFPIPDITWKFNGKDIQPPLQIVGDYNRKLLQFPVYNDSFAGKYVCTAKNKAGHVNSEFHVETYVDHSLGTASVVAIALTISVLVIVPILLFLMTRWLAWRNPKMIEFTEAEIQDFIVGFADENEDSSDQIALALPYNNDYEILKDQFQIDRKCVLGKGAFGIVFKGTVSTENYDGVAAFKTIKANSDAGKIKSLLAELKIMIYVGHHENIVRLIAAYTKEIQYGIVYVITELCSLGSLESYLRRDEKSNDDLDSQRKSQIFSKCKLSKWSMQIASGMEYLAFKRIVHSDLATRNVLLDSNETAKITDFGLSSQMYNYYEYVRKEKKDLLPWKWLAIESLRTTKFSTQSDVWAYGITLWEIYSLGSTPYPGITWTIEFVELLENGLRNLKPKLADSQIYNVMRSCWAADPKERPTFSCLRTFFTTLVDAIANPAEGIDQYAVLD